MKTRKKLVYGMGINDSEQKQYFKLPNGTKKSRKEYDLWRNMLLSAINYNIEICDDWLRLSKFEKFLENFNLAELREQNFVFVAYSRDINCKLYSPETAGFISINLQNLIKAKDKLSDFKIKYNTSENTTHHFSITTFCFKHKKYRPQYVKTQKDAKLLHCRNIIKYIDEILKPNEFENGKQCIETLISFYEDKIANLEKEI